jgi:restriction system protein
MSHRGFISTLNAIAREAERRERANQRAVLQAQKATERELREATRSARAEHIETRENEANALNVELEQAIAALERILKDASSKSAAIDLTAYRKGVSSSDIKDPSLKLPPAPNKTSFEPAPVSFFGKLLPGWRKRHAAAQAVAESRFEDSLRGYHSILAKRNAALIALQAEAAEHNNSLDASIEAIKSGVAEEVCSYFETVLSASEWPAGFHEERQIAYTLDSKQIVVDVRLPTIEESIPTVFRYRYVRSSDQILETPRPEKNRRALYENVVAQSALRVLHEVMSGDQYNCVSIAVVNAYVSTIDPSNGRGIRPYLVSVRVSRDGWSEIDLRNVDPVACLKGLRATVSNSPSELLAVKPIVDINMVDRRFIAEQDVLSELDSRSNLMELSPSEFESLITNLFQKMGLETKLTQASRDGGVDCVAFDLRPILGGKVIIQAKRYKNTVGVSAVRDLFGTMHNEGASKGILVTTSGYGKAAYDFANGKPLELITGSNLLYLLEEHAGVKAKIVIPDDWVDRLNSYD